MPRMYVENIQEHSRHAESQMLRNVGPFVIFHLERVDTSWCLQFNQSKPKVDLLVRDGCDVA